MNLATTKTLSEAFKSTYLAQSFVFRISDLCILIVLISLKKKHYCFVRNM